ncbi:MAG: FHA domain-containing protein [Myxococcales bacterium FL481]|nr:MAG: FHA domain-containing protein [Myxococcales bacterium FL481]TPV95128.1 MAG: FHA domain-containing protein [Myxococcales bacterium FL481]
MVGVRIGGLPLMKVDLIVPRDEVGAGGSVSLGVGAIGRVPALVDKQAKGDQPQAFAARVSARAPDTIPTRGVGLARFGVRPGGSDEAITLVVRPHRHHRRPLDRLVRGHVEHLAVERSVQRGIGERIGGAAKRGGSHHGGASECIREHEDAEGPKGGLVRASGRGAQLTGSEAADTLASCRRARSIAGAARWQVTDLVATAKLSMSESTTCPGCGAERVAGAVACPACGAGSNGDPTHGTMSCPACGSSIAQGFQFCPMCGAGLAGVQGGRQSHGADVPPRGPARPDDTLFPGVRPAGQPSVFIVLVGRDGSEGRAIPIPSAVVLGRRGADEAFPDDQFVSPRHVRVVPLRGGVRLVDLESRNGVFVRIGAPVPVYPGDSFLLGHQLLRLDGMAADEGIPPRDANGVRGFGTPLAPAWGCLTLLGVGARPADIFFLRERDTRLGRETGEILFPQDAFLSRQHARLRMELRGGAMNVVLEDLGSANGTYLRMRGEAELSRGDMFRVGDQVFRVKC